MDIVNIRWQSAPLVGGFDVALRLLDGNFKHVNVLLPHEMGLEASQLAIIENLGKVTGGATFLTGETGSAKTTLLRAMSYLVPNRDRIKQFAVNEPSKSRRRGCPTSRFSAARARAKRTRTGRLSK
jgi:Mg-chelatase subunit ChlI